MQEKVLGERLTPSRQYIDGIVDIIGESSNVEKYYENEILKQILFTSGELSDERRIELIYDYGTSLHEKDVIGRRVFVHLAMAQI